RANTVKVVVSEGKLSEIEPISGVVDQGKGSTKMLYDRVIANQSLMVDTISGATLTSKGYLKAVEIALSQAN
ncbi:MAG: FMN-binding protein, partial [Anaerolineae bacterium]|nr:FMN-binding protein [Anaerolineae bacterium]